MKHIFHIIILFFFTLKVNAQAYQLIDKVIDNDDKRKVEKARKLFNQLKIFEGEKELKDLVKNNPNQVYFYEALVQMQRQVLYRVKNAYGELDDMNENNPDLDEEINDENNESSIPSHLQTNTQLKESLGLDMTKINVKDEEKTNDKEETKKEKKSKKDKKSESEKPKEATVTIDSSMIYTEDQMREFAQDYKDENGKPIKLSNKEKRKLKILETFAQIPYDSYKYDLIQNARSATRLFFNADSSSHYLRKFMIDTLKVDTNIEVKAWDEYKLGIEDYYEKMIPSAAKHFENAISINNLFYSAHLKLGDIYYMMNKDTASIAQYKMAAMICEDMPEPYVKLAMMQYNRGKYTDAAASMIEAIMKYPESEYFEILRRIIEKTGLGFDSQWIRREVYPLTTTSVNEDIVVNDKSPWWHYQAAKQDVYSYFNPEGLVLPNDKTQERYLEIYGWKKMLNNASPKLFTFARAMEKIGYLDCYTLITLYHIDVYGQFKDLVKRNPDKVKKYFYLLINWQDKKFDKLRKSVEVKDTKSK